MHVRSSRRSLLVTLAVPFGLLAAGVAVPFAFQERCPEPLAVHFTNGRADDAAPLWPTVREIFGLGTGAWLLMGLLTYLRPAGSLGRRIAAGAALAAATTTISLTVLLG